MRFQFKYQTLSNFALLLMLIGLLIITFINDRQANRTITSQIEVRDVHYQALDKSSNLFALSSDTYAKITNYIDNKSPDKPPSILALKEIDELDTLLSKVKLRLSKIHLIFEEFSYYVDKDESLLHILLKVEYNLLLLLPIQ